MEERIARLEKPVRERINVTIKSDSLAARANSAEEVADHSE